MDIVCSGDIPSYLSLASSSSASFRSSCPVKVHWDQLVVPGFWGGSGVEGGLSEPLSLWLWVGSVLEALSLCLPGVLEA